MRHVSFARWCPGGRFATWDRIRLIFCGRVFLFRLPLSGTAHGQNSRGPSSWQLTIIRRTGDPSQGKPWLIGALGSHSREPVGHTELFFVFVAVIRKFGQSILVVTTYIWSRTISTGIWERAILHSRTTHPAALQEEVKRIHDTSYDEQDRPKFAHDLARYFYANFTGAQIAGGGPRGNTAHMDCIC